MKRTVAILMALILLVGLAVPLSAADMGKLVLGNEIFLKAGDTKTIPVSIENAGELSVIQFVVEYDSTKLELQNVKPTVIAGKEVNIVTGAEKGTILDGVDSDVKVAKAQISQPELGKVSILWESENTIECNGVLAYLTFEALEDGIGKAGVVVSDEEEFIFKVDSQDEGSSSDIIKDVVEEPMVEEKYTVSFNAGKGTGAPAEVKSFLGQVEIPDVTPVYEGHTFLGWATYSNATEAEYELGKTYEVNQDLDLFAVWVKTPKIVVGEVKGRAGETVEVPVNFVNNRGFASGDIIVSYDKNVMELKDVKKSDLLSAALFTPNVNNGMIGFVAGIKDITESGELFVLEFKIKEDAKDGSYSISLSGKINNEKGSAVDLVFEDGLLKIVSVEPGDVTGDGIINSVDAMFILQYSVGLIGPENLVCPEAADYNNDSIVNSLDAMLTLQKSVGMI